MKPITNFKLNNNCSYLRHDVFGDRQLESDLGTKREFYVIHNQVEDLRRVLTIRTQHVLKNLTSSTYIVKQFYVKRSLGEGGKIKKEVCTVHSQHLLPNGKLSLPD